MSTHKILMLPGDGIGPEVMAETGRVIDWLNGQTGHSFETESDLVGGSAYDAHGEAISESAMDKAWNLKMFKHISAKENEASALLANERGA